LSNRMDSDFSEDEDEYDFQESSDEEMLEPPPPKSSQPKQLYELVKREAVYEIMNAILSELVEVTNIPYIILRVLLNEFKWDKDRLLERFYDNPEKLFKDHDILYNPEPDNIDIEGESAECQICFDDVEKQHLLIGASCGHYFCKDCYRQYCLVKIETDGENCILCPYHKCRSFVDDGLVFDLFSRPGSEEDLKVRRRYKKLIVDAFVLQHRAMMFCSTPDCEVVVKMSGGDRLGMKNTGLGIEVNCECRESLCSACCAPWHNPVQCHLLKKWKKKCDDDSETYNWINANTKECPKCRATIEKDGGCNHVICRNAACRYEFCWVCLSSWKAHGSSFYNCNRYNEDDSNDARKSQENSRANLQRYLFYFNRFHNHSQSLKFEHRVRGRVESKMDALLEKDMSWVEVQFLRSAVEVLRKSRQCLMFTYVFAFYLQKTNNAEIFEHNQGDLERATEELSEVLEREIPENVSEIGEIKRLVQDKARYCDDRSKRLIDHVHEGYIEDTWLYREKL